MARPKKEWIENLKQKIITEEMVSMALYSSNKRAKNCRERIKEYEEIARRYPSYNGGVAKYKKDMERHYEKKRIMLTLLTPLRIQDKILSNGYIQRLYYYETNYGKFHQPIESKHNKLTKKKRSTPRTRVLRSDSCPLVVEKVSFTTKGANIKDLVSCQFTTKICNLIISGQFTYIPEDRRTA